MSTAVVLHTTGGAQVERTLICEYVGSVDFVWSRMTSDDDSLMDLLRTESPDTSLVISPRRIGNVARFLCHGAPGASRNVQTARFDIGECSARCNGRLCGAGY